MESSGQSWNRKEKNAPENADTATSNLNLTTLSYEFGKSLFSKVVDNWKSFPTVYSTSKSEVYRKSYGSRSDKQKNARSQQAHCRDRLHISAAAAKENSQKLEYREPSAAAGIIPLPRQEEEFQHYRSYQRSRAAAGRIPLPRQPQLKLNPIWIFKQFLHGI